MAYNPLGRFWSFFRNPFAFLPERWYVEGKPTRWGSGPDTDRDQYAETMISVLELSPNLGISATFLVGVVASVKVLTLLKHPSSLSWLALCGGSTSSLLSMKRLASPLSQISMMRQPSPTASSVSLTSTSLDSNPGQRSTRSLSSARMKTLRLSGRSWVLGTMSGETKIPGRGIG